MGLFVNLLQHFVQPRDLVQLSVRPWDLPSTFRAAARPSVKLLQLSMLLWDLPSTFRAAVGLSVNFQCVRGTLYQLP